MQAETNRVALVAGASGMVGLALVRHLVARNEYSRTIAVSRRPLSMEAPRLANRIIRFEAMETELRGLACEDAFCCLGTTLRDAGSPEAFRAVDHDLVLRFARVAKTAGATSLVVVSAAGASADAGNFYLRVKGETERALEALQFRSLHLLQPGLLLGARAQWRPLELLGRVFMPVLNPLLLGRYEQWRGIGVDTVAAAMAAAALSGRLGVQRYTWRALNALARTGKAPLRPGKAAARL
jgi:uncharacterized protein YbjT (DUF2867 family)